MDQSKYTALSEYFHHIKKHYGLHICINDYAGFISLDKSLTAVLRPFLLHPNDYCMYIKSNKHLWKKCINMKKPIAEKCRTVGSIYYGMCHAGVEEFIVPVIHNDQLIAVINAGVFRSRENTAGRLIKRMCKKYNLDEATLLKNYISSLSSEIPDINEIRSILGIASEYLSSIFASLSKTYSEYFTNKAFNTSEDFILNHIIEYIKRNFADNIMVSDIAHFCHCSESHINHIFKKKTDISISHYINKIRLEAAKSYLQDTDLSIKNISSRVGYNDPNYFSKVFSDMCKISPTRYRKNYR